MTFISGIQQATPILRFYRDSNKKTLRNIAETPCYVSNEVDRRDLQICSVEDEIQKYSVIY